MRTILTGGRPDDGRRTTYLAASVSIDGPRSNAQLLRAYRVGTDVHSRQRTWRSEISGTAVFDREIFVLVLVG